MKFFDEQLVSLVVENLLVLPARNRMCRGGNNLESVLLRQRRNDRAQASDVGTGFLNIFADARADFDLGLNHLGLDLFAEQHPAFVKKLHDVRLQLARLGIDDLKLLFNAECELIEHGYL